MMKILKNELKNDEYNPMQQYCSLKTFMRGVRANFQNYQRSPSSKLGREVFKNGNL